MTEGKEYTDHYKPTTDEPFVEKLKNRINSLCTILTAMKGNKRLKLRAEKDKEGILKLLEEYEEHLYI